MLSGKSKRLVPMRHYRKELIRTPRQLEGKRWSRRDTFQASENERACGMRFCKCNRFHAVQPAQGNVGRLVVIGHVFFLFTSISRVRFVTGARTRSYGHDFGKSSNKMPSSPIRMAFGRNTLRGSGTIETVRSLYPC